MNFNKFQPNQYHKGTIGLAHDDFSTLSHNHFHFPLDATMEWENEKTILKIKEIWEELGYKVVLLPLNTHFFQQWEKHFKEFIFVHSLVEGWGSVSREGWIASLCELSGIPCLGSEPIGHAISMHKSLLKDLCRQWGIKTAPSAFIRSEAELYSFKEKHPSFFLEPHFIKPNDEGSGMGVDFEGSYSESFQKTLVQVCKLLQDYPEGLLIEKFLGGHEYTSAIISTPLAKDSSNGLLFLPIAQISVPNGIYGFHFKGKDSMEEEVTFPELPSLMVEEIKKGTHMIYDQLRLKDFVRMDWRCDTENKNVYFLEANTLAGLSYYYSVLPKMAEHAQIGYKDLFQIFEKSVLSRKDKKNVWYGQARFQQPYQKEGA